MADGMRNALSQGIQNFLSVFRSPAEPERPMPRPAIPASMKAQEIDPVISAYRYDLRRGDIETLPYKFQAEPLRNHYRALGEAIRAGVPGIADYLDPETVMAMTLLEGRNDIGTNEFNLNDPRSKQIYETFAQKYGPDAGMFVAAAYDKAKVARNRNVPFGRAWNGLGRSRYASGQQYAERLEEFKKATRHPKNKAFREFVERSMAGE
jgi:hypothetical protein